MNIQSNEPPAPQPQLPSGQACAKCGAAFRWEPSNPAEKGSPLVLRLDKPSDDCDCGYGTAVLSL